MKKIFSNIRTMAALLMAGAAFAACSSSDDSIIENEQPANTGKQVYTLTVSASKDGAATRALTDDNNAIVASWATTDVIYVTKGTTAIGTLSPTSINGLEATFTGTISGDAGIAASDVLTLTYHPIASFSAFASQDGTLNGSANSAENFDMAVATVTISGIDGNTIVVSESQASFVNQTAVVVLKTYNSEWSERNLRSLTVSATMNIPNIGPVTEKFGPFAFSGNSPYYFALPSQTLLAEKIAAKYSLNAVDVSTLLASATITFTGQEKPDPYYYLTCSKTGYKFAAGKYYKLDNNNFAMSELIKYENVEGKDIYVSALSDRAWTNTVTYAVNIENGWRTENGFVYCGDKQLYFEDTQGEEPISGYVKATDDFRVYATYTLVTPTLIVATTADYGKVVCASGHLHDAKTAVPSGCTAVGILGKVTETGHGLILALQDATSQMWGELDSWTSETTYAGTTLKVLPNDAARGTNLTSYTTLGTTAVSNWAVAQKSDYEAIFTNLGSTLDNYGQTYDDNVNAYITEGVGGTALSETYWSATWSTYDNNSQESWAYAFSNKWWGNANYIYNSLKVRPVLGF